MNFHVYTYKELLKDSRPNNEGINFIEQFKKNLRGYTPNTMKYRMNIVYFKTEERLSSTNKVRPKKTFVCLNENLNY